MIRIIYILRITHAISFYLNNEKIKYYTHLRTVLGDDCHSGASDVTGAHAANLQVKRAHRAFIVCMSWSIVIYEHGGCELEVRVVFCAIQDPKSFQLESST